MKTPKKTITVIKPGKLPTRYLRGECITCGCVIQAMPADCPPNVSFGSTKIFSIQCPTKDCVRTIYMQPPPWEFGQPTQGKRITEEREDITKLTARVETLERLSKDSR